MICMRLAVTQARCWELAADTLLYEAPPELEEVEIDVGPNFQKAADELSTKGRF